jgi:hypothetical protein
LPALSVMEPDPVPVDPTVSVEVGGGLVVNVAVTDWAPLIVTVHVPMPEQPPPDQAAKLDPDAGVAVNVTIVPDG